MPRRVVPDDAQPCVWMSAGLLTYKICDRRFDCEHCPLDAGLRAGTLAGWRHQDPLAARGEAALFPDDRLYTAGHWWLKAAAKESHEDQIPYRLGLDAFAAAIVGHCCGVRCEASPNVVRGGTLCRLDLGLGMLSLRAPLSGVFKGTNELLEDDPGRLTASPYDDGWILDFLHVDTEQLDELMTADAARAKARLDLRRFRRRIAVELFADGNAVGQTGADGGELVTDLREMLGGAAYLELVQELIH